MEELTFLPFDLRRSSRPISPSCLVSRLATVPGQGSVNNSTDNRAPSPEAAAAMERASRTVYDHLSAGRLSAYIYIEVTDTYKIIPAAFWRDDINWHKRLGNRIWDPFEPYWNHPVLLLEDEVAWLTKSVEPKAKRGPKDRYEWAAFHAAAVGKLEYEGLYTEGWRSADLEKFMYHWCETNWEKVPSESMIRSHVGIARDQFITDRTKADI